LADWLSLRATNEAVWIPMRETSDVRRLLNAWTQLSEGKLRVQAATDDRLEWAWVEDGVLEWTVMLRDDGIVVVDSSVALDHVRKWETEGGRLAEVLVARGVDEMLEGADRSGAYLDFAALRSLGEPFVDIARGFDAASVVAKTDGDNGEMIRIRLIITSETARSGD
jgi:hypothetical protein